jgi:hypothetical protein
MSRYVVIKSNGMAENLGFSYKKAEDVTYQDVIEHCAGAYSDAEVLLRDNEILHRSFWKILKKFNDERKRLYDEGRNALLAMFPDPANDSR